MRIGAQLKFCWKSKEGKNGKKGKKKKEKKITLVNNNNQADNRHQNQSTLQQDFQTKPKLFLFLNQILKY